MSQTYSFSILLPVHSEVRMLTHGDYYFGRSLVRALERLGHTARVLPQKFWHHTEPDDIALVIRGQGAPTQMYGRLLLEWCISCQPTETTGEFEHVDHFFAASPKLAARLTRRGARGKVSVMYQAFDPDVMFADGTDAAQDMVFVGTPRNADRRPVVNFAVQSGLPLQVWGNGWDQTDHSAFHAGGNVENDRLGDVYRASTVVLNDHLVVMKRNALVSNRVYDALACGRAILSDASEGLPPELMDYVHTYQDAQSFKESAQNALSETPERKAERMALAQAMRQTHSFDQRAQQVCNRVDDLLSAG
jgi:hypothetical protein